jgi:hypothetical protein
MVLFKCHNMDWKLSNETLSRFISERMHPFRKGKAYQSDLLTSVAFWHDRSFLQDLLISEEKIVKFVSVS